jgi:S-DNA-T family DNA segregation ATPase FtsK/SpoIIIE
MDREERQHAVVVFAHLRLNLFGRCIIGGGRHVEETLLAAVKRARRKAVDLSDRDGDEAFRQAAQKGADDDEPTTRLRPGEKRPTAPGVLAPRPSGEKVVVD